MPPGSLVATDRSKAVVFTNLKYFGIFRLISVFETTALLKF